MERIFGLKKVAGFPRPIVTLGVFDGVHRGHSLVLREAIRWAKQVGGTSVVITFDRHPDAVLNRRAAAAITSLEHRLVLLQAESLIYIYRKKEKKLRIFLGSLLFCFRLDKTWKKLDKSRSENGLAPNSGF